MTSPAISNAARMADGSTSRWSAVTGPTEAAAAHRAVAVDARSPRPEAGGVLAGCGRTEARTQCLPRRQKAGDGIANASQSAQRRWRCPAGQKVGFVAPNTVALLACSPMASRREVELAGATPGVWSPQAAAQSICSSVRFATLACTDAHLPKERTPAAALRCPSRCFPPRSRWSGSPRRTRFVGPRDSRIDSNRALGNLKRTSQFRNGRNTNGRQKEN
mgnify:FL=1